MFSQQKLDSIVNSNPPLLAYDKTSFDQYMELARSRYLRNKVANADSLYNHASLLISDQEKNITYTLIYGSGWQHVTWRRRQKYGQLILMAL